jgi:hypothetical protein
MALSYRLLTEHPQAPADDQQKAGEDDEQAAATAA